MELSENTPLNLPLFLLNDQIEQRDIKSPDLTLEVILDETLLAHLCQNPSADENISINLQSYQLKAEQVVYDNIPGGENQAQLLLNHGPILSAVVSVDDEHVFISPPIEMMPTFDLGEEEDS
ncbi:hypothetical protein PSECIP111951_03385 [Pseudoalteromonas holothuriae]|uniref:Orphan protein n=1 Tax=Pseudoalteromonas holothuriae TaxID=2963714 RepID=A0ABN8UPY7_9GAMM|nr:hypothetical protein [Pseudoalteromonas sp. CIP111951]CAH9065538.1 hypothetical protein PSECIP111951_03385 [Pseudoalteromonas sp. CIP111951]